MISRNRAGFRPVDVSSAVALLILGASFGGASQAARAQEAAAEPVALEEVVVTARKREESILEVPMAITAFTADDIARSDINGIRDLGAFSPGLNFQPQVGNGPGGRAQGSIIFRGMAPVQGVAREQSGSVFVDGMFVSGGVQSIDTSDVERIEVLRGPQNAYFGRSTFGGAINYVTRTPSEKFSGKAALGFGQRGSRDFSASIEGPIAGDWLSGRLSGVHHERGWQYVANDGGKLGEEQTQSVTGTLLAKPLDAWTVRLRGHFQRDDDGPLAISYIRGMLYGSTCPGQTFGASDKDGNPISFALSRPYFCGSVPNPSQLPSNFITANTTLFPAVLARVGKPNLLYDIVANNSFNNWVLSRAPHMDHQGLRRDVTRLALQNEYTFANDITLAANVGYEQNYGITVYDVDRSDNENAWAALPQLNRSQSAEIRLQSGQKRKFRWLLGYNWFKLEAESQQIGYQIQAALGGATPTAGYQNARVDDISEVPAVFGSVEYDLLDNLTLGAEVRRQKDKNSILSSNLTRSGFTFTDTLPRVFARWEPVPDLNLYATWGKGVMPGQLNSQFATATPAQQAEICAQFPSCSTLAPLPKVKNIELGVKQRLLGGRLQYALSVYDMDWKNINTSVTAFVSTSPFAIGVIAPNDARLRGVEFESRFLITQGWDVALNLNVQDNEYTRFYNATLATLTSGASYFDGNEIPKSPSRSGTISTGYTAALGNQWTWHARADVIYTGSMWDSEANIAKLDSYTRVNGRIGFETDTVALELYARNLFDDRHWSYASRSTSLSEPGALLQVPYGGSLTTVQGLNLVPPDRREIGLRATYRF